MTSIALSAPASSRPLVWGGRTVSGLAVAFLLFDAAIKFTGSAPVADSFAQLGMPLALAPTVGMLELACLALYVLPRTSFLGAVLLTGYLGGATVLHVRVGNPLASHVLFPAYLGLLLWGGLVLRDARVRALFFGHDRAPR